MTIIATPGAPDANSFLTVVEADAYLATRLYTGSWTTASNATKESALQWASRILDQEDWVGNRVSATQGLRWPRYEVYDPDGYYVSSTIVPQFLKNATAELAFALTQQDRTSEAGTEGFSKIVVGPIELDINSLDRIEVVSPYVSDMIDFYLESAGSSAYMQRG